MDGAQIPQLHRARQTRLRFSTHILTETTSYRVVEGFGSGGNSMHVISKNGGPNFRLHPETDQPIYPNQVGLDKQNPISVSPEDVFAAHRRQKERV